MQEETAINRGNIHIYDLSSPYYIQINKHNSVDFCKIYVGLCTSMPLMSTLCTSMFLVYTLCTMSLMSALRARMSFVCTRL